MRILIAILILGLTLSAANVRLYLKDGGYQLVREYQVQGERVRYYSTERGDWEEIPIELVDLKRTKAEETQLEADRKRETAEQADEDRAEVESAREIQKVPKDPGVWWVDGDQLKEVKAAEMKI